MSENVLSVHNLHVVYKSDREIVSAVNGISFDLKNRETLGIVGETGAGKTTTALSIMRLLPQYSAKITEGNLSYLDRDLLSCSESEMRKIRGEQIAMIFQDPMTALNPVLTIGNQIGESIMFHNPKMGKDEIEQKVDETLRLVSIPPARKNDYPHQFSGGMKQRVIIAMALACKPAVLIADEPTTALDVTIQAQILRMIQDLKEEMNTSMILITHDLGIIVQMCDRVAVMYSGEIVEYGTTKDIFTAADKHPYTKGLFGSIPNLKKKTRRLNPIPGLMPDPTNLPTGCPFSPRCPYKLSMCATVKPMEHVADTHHIKCHLFN